MFQFFVEMGQVRDGHAYITGGDVNHITNVLRLQCGDRLQVVQEDDPHLYLCAIAHLDDQTVDCTIEQTLPNRSELPSRICLFQGLPKSDKMEWILQKAVELGVHEIIPVKTENTVVKLDEKRSTGKVKRWQAIAEAAAKQSKRGIIPQVHEVLSYKEALTYMSALDVRLMAYEHADADGMEETRTILSAIRPGASIGILIGPEGGFSPREAKEAGAMGVHGITLGRRILRTETAGLTVLSWLVYLLEN